MNEPGRVDFAYEISDERLLAYSRMPFLDKLKWLDEVRLFTLMMREAPNVAGQHETAEKKDGKYQ